MAQYIVVSRSYGGFDIQFLEPRLRELGAIWPQDSSSLIRRDDPLLVQAVRELLTDPNFENLDELEVVEIPDGVEWEIGEYDGAEWVAERHRRW